MFRFTIRDVLWLTVVVALGVALAGQFIATRGSRQQYLEGYYAGVTEELDERRSGVVVISCFFGSDAFHKGCRDGQAAIRSADAAQPAEPSPQVHEFLRRLKQSEASPTTE